MNLSTPNKSPASNFHRRRTKIGPMARSRYGTPITPLLRWNLEGKHGSVNCRDRDRLQFPARKLAAGLWQFHFKEISGGAGGKGLKRGTHRKRIRRRSQGVGEVNESEVGNVESKNGRGETEQMFKKQSKKGTHERQRKAAATKWESQNRETADALGRFYSHNKLVGEKRFTSNSDMKAELVQTKTRIRSFESRHRYSKKKVEPSTGKLEEDMALIRRRSHPKLGIVVNELDLERKIRRKIEILNANLVKELADSKMYATKYKKEYEKEKKSRTLMEEVCTELAKQIVEDKAKVEALKGESMKLCEELEEERKMLQMAEVWREERIQMKLIDAKLALEDKYFQMNKLITDLENFLMSRSEKLDVMELKRAELIQQAAKSVTIEDIEELFYEPQTQNIMLSLLEDLKEANILEEIEQSNSIKGPHTQDSLVSTDLDQNIGGGSGKEVDQCVEEPPHELDKFDSSNRMREICSLSLKQTKEKIIDENKSGRFSNRTMSSEGGEKSWQQRETENPHIRRGTQGCIEWPKGIQRNCFKTKPLDARIESQKSQLRHVLKHKIK